MYCKIKISGTIELISGLHIGTSDAFAAIGAIDSPVIRDSYNGLPMIPGSSLKGKMRYLLSKSHPSGIIKQKTADEDSPEICRLFGSAKDCTMRNSRLIFSDMVLSNKKELSQKGIQSETEAKHENSINRLTSEANPRIIERVIRGAEFPLSIIYNAEDDADIISDFKLIKEGLMLLTYDYLGGNGSRGYGKVAFNDLEAEIVVGEISPHIIDECNNILKG